LLDDVSNFINFPSSIGLTGYAVDEKNLIYCNNLEKENKFNPSIDNIVGIYEVYNIMICPIVDYEKNFLSVFSDVKNDDR
jgi:hypothetical protein